MATVLKGEVVAFKTLHANPKTGQIYTFYKFLTLHYGW